MLLNLDFKSCKFHYDKNYASSYIDITLLINITKKYTTVKKIALELNFTNCI